MTNRAFTSKSTTPELAKARVSIVGARGYSGVELARLLLRHPLADLASCFATSSFRLSDSLPERVASDVNCLPVEQLLESVRTDDVNIVFLATPAETSIDLAPKILETGASVIDLSGAFRLQRGTEPERVAIYKKWYGFDHAHTDLLAKAEFGLVPWLKSEARLANGPHLIANPGCFATAILLAALPLLKAGVIDPATLVIDAKSGTSGAGRKAEERLLHCEVDGNCLPYKIGRHQHEPEITQFVSHFAEKDIAPFFTTHLLPVRRGIIASLYARVSEDWKSDSIEEKIESVFAERYGDEPLIECASLSRDGGERLLSLRRVVGSARTQIAFRVEEDRLYLFSLIDNLLKGAASQAVENLNRLLGVPTWTGLTDLGGVL